MQSPTAALAAVLAAALALAYTAAPSSDATKASDAARPAVAVVPFAKPPADHDPAYALEKLLDDYLLTHPAPAPDDHPRGESPKSDPAPPLAEPISQKLAAKGHTVRSLIVMVPDPGDTSFDFRYDQILDAVQRATVAAGYLVTSFSNPWDDYKVHEANWRAGRAEGKDPPKHSYRSHPAYILSRDATEPKRLLVTMLVGESPTAGVQRKALAAALDSVERLKPVRPSELDPKPSNPSGHPEQLTVRIVGPNFSGSQSSLEAVLLDWKSRGPGKRVDPPARRDWKFRVVSGSANGLNSTDSRGEIGQVLLTEGGDSPGEIARTLVANDVLMSAAVHYLARRDESGTDNIIKRGEPDSLKVTSALRGKVAVLREGNTKFGFGAKSLTGVIDLPFPLHVAQLRASFDQAQVKREKELGMLADDPLLPILVQDAAADPSSDRIAPHDPRTTAALNGVNMLEITRTLRQEQVKYVGIVTTDIRDALFLSGLLKQYCPDVVQFTTNSERIVTLPQYQYAARGLVVASTYPLAPHVSNWAPRPDGTDTRNNFQSQSSQATYNAVLAQLGKKDLMADYGPPEFLRAKGKDQGHPPIWISVVSPSGQFVPLQAFPKYDDPYIVTRTGGDIGSYADKPLVRLPKSFAFLLVGFWVLWVSLTYAYLRRWSRGDSAPWWGGGQRLSELVGLLSQAALYVVLTKVACLHFRVDFTSGEGQPLGSGLLVAANLLVGLAFAAAFGRWFALCCSRLTDRVGSPKSAVAVAVAAALVWQVTVVMAVTDRYLLFDKIATGPSAAEVLFLERATNLSGWFSPLMPLAFLATAGLAWASLQMRQTDLLVRFSLDSPLPTAGAPAARCAAGELRRWLTTHTSDWWATVLAVAAAVAVLGVAVGAGFIPTDEGDRWDAFFFAAFAAGVFLGGLFVARFVQFWLRLKAVLRAWALLPIAGAFERLPEPAREVFGGYLFTRRPRHSDLAILRHQVELLRQEFEAKSEGSPDDESHLPALLRAIRADFPAGQAAGDAEPGTDDWPGKSRNKYSALAADLAGELQPYWDKRGTDAAFGHPAPSPADAAAGAEKSAAAKSASEPAWVRLAEEVVAAQGLVFLGQYFLQLRGRVWGLAVGPVLLLMAVTSYPFHPAQLLLLIALGLIAAALGAMLGVVIDVARDPVVARLTRAAPGRGRLDTSALGHVLQYVLPVVGVVAAQLSGSLRAVLEPLLHILR